MTNTTHRLARVEAALAPPWSLEAHSATAAARSGLDAGSVRQEAERILALGETPAEALRAAAAELAEATGRPVEDVVVELRQAAAELLA